MVKIDLGAHVDGYIAVGAHTVVVGHVPNTEAPITGKHLCVSVLVCLWIHGFYNTRLLYVHMIYTYILYITPHTHPIHSLFTPSICRSPSGRDPRGVDGCWRGGPADQSRGEEQCGHRGHQKGMCVRGVWVYDVYIYMGISICDVSISSKMWTLCYMWYMYTSVCYIVCNIP